MDQIVRLLFHELADLSGPEREKVFAERQVAPELRAEVESLLAHDAAKTHSFTHDVFQGAREALTSDQDRELSYCGPYRLVRLLGAGGMGAVYLGERTDGEIQHKVAVKLLRNGLGRPGWRDRFLRERQFLADLNHASIARLLDAGHTGDGQPYLVMEYVDGVPIDTFAAQLNLRHQLQLFVQVCEAVSHAHRHLIIHRDLKPSNILVDASGQPKLLDFGIAKLLTTTGNATQTVDRLLTPYYASPEQLHGRKETTATDVYSLGAVLYKLQTGRSPHEPSGEGAQDAPVRRDLDYVLRKALRDEPEERYASVDALADDVRAFLDNRPVQARSGDAWYRTRKFLRRRWLAVAAGVLIITSLTVGFGVANYQRAIAQRRFNEVRQLSSKLFEIDAQVRTMPGITRTRQFIVDTSLEYLRSLANDAQGDPDLALDVGTAYMRVGRVQGVPISANLGQSENAEESLRVAEGLIHSVLAAQPANRTAFLRVAQIAHDRMVLAQARRPDNEALPLAIESEKWLEQYLNTGAVDEAEKNQVVIIGLNVANWYLRKERLDEGMRLLRRTIEIAFATNQPHQAGAAQIVMARAHRDAGDLDAALAAIRDGARLLEPAPGKQTNLASYALALVTQGEVLGEDNAISLGRPREAAEYFERGYKIAADIAQKDANDARSRFSLSSNGIRLAAVLRHWDPVRAIAIYNEVLRAMAEVKNNPRARRDEIRAFAGSTFPLRKLGRYAEARQQLDAAFSRLNDLELYPADKVEPGSEPDDTLRALAEYEADRNAPRGIEIYQELLQRLMASELVPESKLQHALSLSNLYDLMSPRYRRSGQAEKAAELDTRRMELWRHWDRKLPGNSFVGRQRDASR